jgi:hypothetical protein
MFTPSFECNELFGNRSICGLSWNDEIEIFSTGVLSQKFVDKGKKALKRGTA